MLLQKLLLVLIEIYCPQKAGLFLRSTENILTFNKHIDTLFAGVRCNVLEFNPAQQTKASLDVGGQVKVFCSSPDEIRACIFRSPLGETYVFLDGDKYENDRITNYLKTDNQCGMEIHSLEDGDNGQWECLLSTKNPDTQQSASIHQFFNLEIAGM